MIRIRSVACVIALAAGVLQASAAQAADERLLSAASRGDVKAVRALRAGRADVNAANVDGTTPLHQAVWAGELEIADALLRAGARATAVNAFGVTPAYIAAEQGNAALLGRLLDAGADANTADATGDTLLMAAVRA
jgi:ankyrin repeat protein